jgi:hypothetical protein
MTVGHNPPVPASPRCCIWLLGLGFQDLDKRTLDLGFKTWVSGPRQMHRYRTSKALHPTVVLSFSRHFSLRPPSLFFFPSLFSVSSVTFLFPVTFLYVHRHFSQDLGFRTSIFGSQDLGCRTWTHACTCWSHGRW